MTDKLKIFVVDDDDIDRMAVQRALRSADPNTAIDEAATANEAVEILRSEAHDCVLLDYMLPDGDGLQVLNKIRDLGINTPVVILTGETDERLIVEFLRAGASDYLSKNNFTGDTLIHCVKTAIRLGQTDKEKRQAQEELRKSHTQLQEAHRNLQETHEQLLQSEKLASIGQLAAGVAHEINNPVGYVYSNLGTLQNYLENLCKMLESYEKLESLVSPDDAELKYIQELKSELDVEYLKDDVRDLVSESCEGISRVKGIVQDLKDFSHVDEAEWQWADIHRGLDSTLNIVNNEIKYKADVVKQYGDIPQIECLASQLNQVFMNLLVNAAHAIEERGTITIRTGRECEQIWIEVADTGVGIKSDNLHKIFDPFFTTKSVGKGTGLGLSLSYGIVNTHGGHIEVDSEVGKGTSFRVWLPIAQQDTPENEAEANVI